MSNQQNISRNFRRVFGFLVIFTILFTCEFTPIIHAAPYVISQTEAFRYSDPNPPYINEWGYEWNYEHSLQETRHTNTVTFYGAPSFLILAGEKFHLTGASYNLSASVDFTFRAHAKDGFFSDAYTKGVWSFSHHFSDEIGFFSDYTSPTIHGSLVAEYWDSWLTNAEETTRYSDSVPIHHVSRSYTRGADDLSHLYVNDYAILVQRDLFMRLYWETNDTHNHIALESYFLQGEINIDYEYNQVPIPGALWLFGPGVAGIICLRGRNRIKDMKRKM